VQRGFGYRTPSGYNHSVPDRLYFSCWLKDNRTQPLLHQFQKLLESFPFSKLAKRGPVLRLYALEHAEPPLMEREFPAGVEMALVIDTCREFMQPDTACEVDAFWDLWQYDPSRVAGRQLVGESGDSTDGWNLSPVHVRLACYGPEFNNGLGDHLRIEFGPDARFLPVPGVEGSLRMGQSNLKSLLHLTSALERRLDVVRRQVWSESGANFADVLKQAVGNYYLT
jgi:hypothetical protein